MERARHRVEFTIASKWMQEGAGHDYDGVRDEGRF